MKCRIHLNGEFQEFTLSETPALLGIQRFFLGCVGAEGQLNGELSYVRLLPYSVSAEQINAWAKTTEPYTASNNKDIHVICEDSLGAGKTISIESGATYMDEKDIDAEYNGLMILDENTKNVFKIITDPETSVDVNVKYIAPNDKTVTQHFVQDFHFNKTQRVTEIFSAFGEDPDLIEENTTYFFNMGKLWSNSYLFNLNEKASYRISFETQEEVENIEQQKVCLCGCVFEDFERDSRENSLITENVRGRARKMF